MPTRMESDEGGTVNTRASLVAGLQAGTGDRWAEFCQVYGPVIRGFAVKAGLTETEADKVVQETSIAVARHVGEFQYDPKVCRFKTWLKPGRVAREGRAPQAASVGRARASVRPGPGGDRKGHRGRGQVERGAHVDDGPEP